MPERSCAIYVDTGTTNTRVWLVSGEQILAEARAPVGVRDTAREGSSQRLRMTLRDLTTRLQQEASAEAQYVGAAGMITSALGLLEIPHILAPAGLSEIGAAVRCCSFADVTDLPVYLVPGVRCGPSKCNLPDIATADIIRGEETLCCGLFTAGFLKPPGTVFTLGSHWKAISLDAEGRIVSSATSLSGELIHVLQTQTVLASSVPQERPAGLDETWMQAGIDEQRRSGLARALFCVRLLEQRTDGSPEQRLSFLIGVVIGSDLMPLLESGRLGDDQSVLLTGNPVLVRAWSSALTAHSIKTVCLSEEDTTRAFLSGLQQIIQPR